MRFLVNFMLILTVISSIEAKASDILRNSMLKDMVQVNVAKDLGRVVYDHSKSKSEFSSIAGSGTKISPNTLGLTVTNLQIDGTTETNTSKVAGGYLVYLVSANMQLFYGDIIVLIDKKYPVGSCEYNAIIAHENKHVGIARLIIDFYTPYVKKEIERIVKTLDPVVVRTTANANAVNMRYSREIQEQLKPLLSLINEQLDKGNAQLDTPQNYQKDTANCSNW